MFLHIDRSTDGTTELLCITFLGIPDPLGALKEGEIFFQIRKTDSDTVERIEGRVLMYRNPCLHPGDIRIVTAVSCPELAGYTNIVILPTAENIERSLSAEVENIICRHNYVLFCCFSLYHST
jgi:RNA dependent RNA polymerase